MKIGEIAKKLRAVLAGLAAASLIAVCAAPAFAADTKPAKTTKAESGKKSVKHKHKHHKKATSPKSKTSGNKGTLKHKSASAAPVHHAILADNAAPAAAPKKADDTKNGGAKKITVNKSHKYGEGNKDKKNADQKNKPADTAKPVAK